MRGTAEDDDDDDVIPAAYCFYPFYYLCNLTLCHHPWLVCIEVVFKSCIETRIIRFNAYLITAIISSY